VVLVVADGREEGVQRGKSRYSWHRGDLRYNAFGRARFPGCAEVVLLGWSHESCEKDGMRSSLAMPVLVLSSDFATDDIGLAGGLWSC
jgi:hypothetical protein